MSDQNLFHHPALKNIDPAKLQTLLSMTEQARGKSQSELLPFLMAASGNSGMKFSPEEMDAIIGVMKAGKSPQEVRRIDQMCAMFKQMRK